MKSIEICSILGVHKRIKESVSSKRYKLACAPIEESDQPAHSHSLISLQWALHR